jgi:hypothetical protein
MYPDPKNKSALKAFWAAGRVKPKRKTGFYFMDLPGGKYTFSRCVI